LLEGSASIRTVPLGSFNERKGREKPTQSGLIACRKARSSRFALHWIQEINRRTFLIEISLDLNVVSLRPIAIVPATPSTLDGLCGPEQRNGVGSSLEVRKDARPPSTVMSGLLYRFTDATAGKIFVRDASAFSIFCVYGCVYSKEAKPSPSCASHPGLVSRFARIY
jgi:hypothetical protein